PRRGSHLRRRDPPPADPLHRLRLDGAVLQPRHGAGRADLRPRVHHRPGPDRGHRHHRAGAGRQDPAAGVHRPGRPARPRRGGTVMARLLVALKLRLLRNALHSSPAVKVSFLVSTIFAVLTAVGTFVILALLRGQTASVDVTAVIFTVFAFGWLILPIFAFGLDSTLDPATLALYPLRLRPLAVGL